MSNNKKKITWTAEKYQRLLAATIAAHPEIKIVCVSATVLISWYLITNSGKLEL